MTCKECCKSGYVKQKQWTQHHLSTTDNSPHGQVVAQVEICEHLSQNKIREHLMDG